MGNSYHRMDYTYQGKQPPSKLAAMAATSNSQHSDQSYWISDTGATDHFTPDLSTIPDHQEYTGTDLATVGNGQAIPTTHIGNSKLKASSHLFHLRKVLCVPSMASNLLSVNNLCHDNNFLLNVISTTSHQFNPPSLSPPKFGTIA